MFHHLQTMFIIFFSVTESSDFNNYVHLNDIMRSDLMPTYLIFDEPMEEQLLTNITKAKKENYKLSYNGTWNEAYVTMKFHRKMINEYLCRNFIADKILNYLQKPVISNRIGKPPVSINNYNNKTSNIKRTSRTNFIDVKDNLLSDPGSSHYRDWLTKTTTLEDIYQHYEKDQPISRIDESEEEYDGGEITGYAATSPHDYRNYPNQNGEFYPQDEQTSQEAEKHGSGYDFTPQHIHIHGENNDEKSHHFALQDIFDVALTSLAFLSFGMFILQVIMCISMNKVQVMQMVDTSGPAPEGGEDIRFKRDLFSQKNLVNELTKGILISIDVGIHAQKDNGACLRKVLCENNKHYRNSNVKEKLLVPMWGLAMSWLSGHIIHNTPKATTILESLKACVLGLANVNCENIYQSCDMEITKMKPE